MDSSTAQKIAESAAMAGMMLSRLDPKRSCVVCVPENMRGKVPPGELRVASTELTRSVGAAGAKLVTWIMRSRIAGVVWMQGTGSVRYLEGRPEELLSKDVRRVMQAEGWA